MKQIDREDLKNISGGAKWKSSEFFDLESGCEKTCYFLTEDAIEKLKGLGYTLKAVPERSFSNFELEITVCAYSIKGSDGKGIDSKVLRELFGEEAEFIPDLIETEHLRNQGLNV